MKTLIKTPFLLHNLLKIILLIDVIFLVLHCLYLSKNLTDYRFSIEADLGFGEFYQYFKMCAVLLLLVLVNLRQVRVVFLAWIPIFLLILADDSFSLHEKLGYYVSYYLNIPIIYGVEPVLWGELMVFSFYGFLCVQLVYFVHYFGSSMEKKVNIKILKLIMIFSFFGVFIDALHMMIPIGKNIMGIIEDGGEMFIMSLILWYHIELCFPNVKNPGLS